MRIVLTALWLLLAFAAPAQAGPVIAALGAAFAGVSAFIATLGPIGAAIVKLGISIALQSLLQVFQKKPVPPGIKTEFTTGGGVNPVSFVLGRYATAGNFVCPPMSHGYSGKVPNAYLTYVIDVGDVPVSGLNGVIINDEYITLGGTPSPDGYGYPVNQMIGRAWVKFLDGTQVAADSMLLAKYAAYPDRPWTSAMIGLGVPCVICTFRFDRKVFSGLPKVKFVVDGLKLYDPRADTSVGGSGAQRWATPSTWAFTLNPMVMIYNILRGITLPDGTIWGGESAAADLPLANWFAGMNACDVAVNILPAGTEPAYRAGLEVSVDQEPIDVIAELLKACSGQMCEIGGVWKIQVGPPASPVYFMTDADIIVTSEQSFTPFPGLDQTFNGIQSSHPDPVSLWQAKDAPPRFNSTYETQDQSRRLIANLPLNAVPYPKQVQRLMRAYIRDERQFRRHTMVLPPDAAILEPLDTTSWTSARNGYTSKLFEVGQVDDSMMTLNQTISERERDSTDYDWGTGDEIAVNAGRTGATPPVSQAVPSWAVAVASVSDGAGLPRRPAVALSWDGDQDDVRGLMFEVRAQATGIVVATGSTMDVAGGSFVVSPGILPVTQYEARGKFIADRTMDWSAWTAASGPTGSLYVINADLLVGGRGSALNSDPDTIDISAWAGAGISIVTDTAAPSGLTVLSCATTNAVLSLPFDINPAKNYTLSIFVKQHSGTTTMTLAAGFKNSAGAAVVPTGWPGSDATYAKFGLLGVTGPAGYTEYRISFGPDEVAQIPASAKTLVIGLLANTTGGSGVQRITEARVVEKQQRDHLIDGAVTDTWQVIDTAAYTRYTGDLVIFTLTLGPLAPGTILKRGISFEARGGVADDRDWELQARKQVLGGAWEAWYTVDSWNEAPGSAWTIRSSSGTLSGAFDNFQYRFVYKDSAGTGGIDTLTNIYLTVVRVTK